MVCFSHLVADSIDRYPTAMAVTLGSYVYDVGRKVDYECYEKQIDGYGKDSP